MMGFFIGVHLMFRIFYEIVVYGASAYGLYKVAKNNGLRFPYIAFVPIVQYSIIGGLCEEYMIKGHRIKRLQIVLPLIFAIIALAGFAGGYGMLFHLAANILVALILHKFFYLFDTKNAFFFALLCMIDKSLLAIILFIIRDKPMRMSAAAYPYPFN